MTVRIGTSGWTYPPWRGEFYPPGLPHRRELAYVAERMNSVEINGSFYALQRPSSYRAWAEAVPADFEFAVKGGRFITHMKKLAGVEAPLANFFASGVLALEGRLGPLLWQLPPTLGFDPARLESFFAQLPRTLGEAAGLAARHDGRLAGDRVLAETSRPEHPIRHVLEVRHESFRRAECYALLRRHEVALVLADNPGKWPIIEEVTSPLMYVRLHGHQELYASGYTEPELDTWADRIRGWVSAGLDVYVYCDNDAKVRAPFDAMGLMSRLGLQASGAGT